MCSCCSTGTGMNVPNDPADFAAASKPWLALISLSGIVAELSLGSGCHTACFASQEGGSY